ncbi:MAG: FAD-binding protein [Aquabacterium sp.]|nr:MAG: FAD-binding protein [Aquabacterium sp.]
MQEVDCVVIGSGFGGAVSALRMAEKGHSVVVLEQGRRLQRADIEAGWRSVRRLIWEPALGLRGYFRQWIFPDVAVVGGVAVGGGSQVFAGVLLRPGSTTFASPDCPRAEADWQAALAPHYAIAERDVGGCREPGARSAGSLVARHR